MKLGLNRRDYVFLGMLLAVGIGIAGYAYLVPKTAGEQIVVTVDGEVFGTYDMREDQKIPVYRNGRKTNLVEISDGSVCMAEADCPDHLCIRQGRISAGGETLVCLPNRVVVEIQSKERGEYDAVAK